MTESEAVKLIGLLKTAWPYAPLSEETIALYARYLLNLDYEAASRAVERLVETSEFPPTVAAIRKATATVMLGLPSQVEAFAGGDFGPSANALIVRTRMMVGDSWHWRTAAETDLRRQFYEAWTAVTERAFTEALRPASDDLEQLMPGMRDDLEQWGRMP
jgi:hypothetical protein